MNKAHTLWRNENVTNFLFLFFFNVKEEFIMSDMTLLPTGGGFGGGEAGAAGLGGAVGG
ncbi:hypothetical protein SP36_57 [Salmonella phage 36]|uniref:Uncharacterized protein n=1 Tax=Salmonella phage 36 TaxID=1654889 RepID=A0A0N6WGC5_9CAUD|nr:hypothetical protein SP36_57 [Salmonella phage 36]AKJ74029.1 hypothetical protein SP36_57 [Salmonella phage 36]